MAVESTAINDLIGQVTRKPRPRDADDWMFGEPDDATELEGRSSEDQDDKGERPALELKLPSRLPQASSPMPAVARRPSDLYTQPVRTPVNWGAIAKFAALPASLSVIGIALIGVYFAKAESKPPVVVQHHIVLDSVSDLATPRAVPEPIETVEPQTIEMIEPAAEPAKAPSAEPTPAVEPGSPASRFLTRMPFEPTFTASNPGKVVAPRTRHHDRQVARQGVSAVGEKSSKGALSIASEPALEVWVDGRSSNASTPLRVILLAGKHEVTLFDKAHGKAHAFEVEIRANETTNVAKMY